MRIKIVQYVHVDRAAWVTDFGVEDSANAVREDVRAFFDGFAQQYLIDNGLDEDDQYAIQVDEMVSQITKEK